MAEQQVGRVIKYFAKPQVAAVDLASGSLKIGDTIRIKGHTTDLTDTIVTMQIEKQSIETANAGDTIGIKVTGRVREGDIVFKVTP